MYGASELRRQGYKFDSLQKQKNSEAVCQGEVSRTRNSLIGCYYKRLLEDKRPEPEMGRTQCTLRQGKKEIFDRDKDIFWVYGNRQRMRSRKDKQRFLRNKFPALATVLFDNLGRLPSCEIGEN